MGSNDILKLKLSQSQKLVLMALVKHSNKNNVAYPSHSTIAETAGVSESTSKRAVKKLAELGFIEITYRKAKNKHENISNLYRILVENIMTLDNVNLILHDSRMTRELKDLNKDLTKDNTYMFEGQNEPTKDDDIKQEIESTIGQIDDKGFISLILKSDKATIKHYLSNWSKFGHVMKINPVGFFIDLCVHKRPIPQEQQSKPNNKVWQETNYEQRQYDDDFYKSLYANL